MLERFKIRDKMTVNFTDFGKFSRQSVGGRMMLWKSSLFQEMNAHLLVFSNQDLSGKIPGMVSQSLLSRVFSRRDTPRDSAFAEGLFPVRGNYRGDGKAFFLADRHFRLRGARHG